MTRQAFKSQNVMKINDLIGCSNSHLRKWIIYQLYGDMTEENYGINWCLDHCIPLKKLMKMIYINIQIGLIKDLCI